MLANPLPNDAIPRTYYMQMDNALHSVCGDYPYGGSNFVNMDQFINTFIETSAAPGANQVYLTTSFSHSGAAVCCVAAATDTTTTCSDLAELKNPQSLMDWKSSPAYATAGLPLVVKIEGPPGGKLSPETSYTGFCAQEQSLKVSQVSFTTLPINNFASFSTKLVSGLSVTLTITFSTSNDMF